MGRRRLAGVALAAHLVSAVFGGADEFSQAAVLVNQPYSPEIVFADTSSSSSASSTDASSTTPPPETTTTELTSSPSSVSSTSVESPPPVSTTTTANPNTSSPTSIGTSTQQHASSPTTSATQSSQGVASSTTGHSTSPSSSTSSPTTSPGSTQQPSSTATSTIQQQSSIFQLHEHTVYYITSRHEHYDRGANNIKSGIQQSNNVEIEHVSRRRDRLLHYIVVLANDKGSHLDHYTSVLHHDNNTVILLRHPDHDSPVPDIQPSGTERERRWLLLRSRMLHDAPGQHPERKLDHGLLPQDLCQLLHAVQRRRTVRLRRRELPGFSRRKQPELYPHVGHLQHNIRRGY
ncbi:hypothetical protein LTR40_007260 [Exophiala xenobiotica]|nr:hypothetical protein LTR40_007260 [Exophiala xenobiotica]